MGYNDHGPIHVAIVANAALKILRNLTEAGVKPSIVADHKLTQDDAEVVVVLVSLLNDIGHIVHRENHVQFSVSIAYVILRELLNGIYPSREAAIITSEALHAIYAHESEVKP